MYPISTALAPSQKTHARAPLSIQALSSSACPRERTRAQGTFCTVQPFWHVVEFVYEHAHQIGESAPLSLYVFKQGLLPDPSKQEISHGSRLHIRLSALCRDHGMRSLADAASALLMHVACATSEYEERVHGIELCFEAESGATCTLWYGEALARDPEAEGDLREEVGEVLNIEGATAIEYMSHAPFEDADCRRHAITARVVQPHATPALNRLLEAIHSSSISPQCSNAITPPRAVRAKGMLSPPRRRHTAIVLHGLKEELERNRRKAHNARRHARHTTATAARGAPEPLDGSDGASSAPARGSLMRRRSASCGGRDGDLSAEALCVPELST